MRVHTGTSSVVNKLHSTRFKSDIEVNTLTLSNLIKNGFNVEYWERKNNCKVIVLDEIKE